MPNLVIKIVLDLVQIRRPKKFSMSIKLGKLNLC